MAVYSPYLIIRYSLLRWDRSRFSFYQLNPEQLSTEQKTNRSALILIHGSRSNQALWIPLVEKLRDRGIGPIYTVSYQNSERMKKLRETIQKVRNVFNQNGVEELVNLDFVVHSLGARSIGQYTYLEENTIPNTTVRKIISLAGRLKGDAHFQERHPSSAACLNAIYDAIQNAPVGERPYVIGGSHDWLVPQESMFITQDPDKECLVDNRSHLNIIFSSQAHRQIIDWLTT